jgi:hypothetical protein
MSSPSVHLIGDLHSFILSFSSLLLHFTSSSGCLNQFDEIFKNNVYIFLGDYVDRENNGVEIFILLSLFKLKYKNNFFLLMGNHESMSSVNRRHGFFEEVKRKYSNTEKVFDSFQMVFYSLPISAVLFPYLPSSSNTFFNNNISYNKITNEAHRIKDIKYNGIFLCHGGIPVGNNNNYKIRNSSNNRNNINNDNNIPFPPTLEEIRNIPSFNLLLEYNYLTKDKINNVLNIFNSIKSNSSLFFEDYNSSLIYHYQSELKDDYLFEDDLFDNDCRLIFILIKFRG